LSDPRAPADPAAPRLRRYWLLTLVMLGFFLLLFAVVELAGVQLLHDPSEYLGRGGPWAAALSFGLLVADVFLPVPSSVLMIANGALFGVARGTALSLAGSLGAALLGFLVGRRGGRLIERLVGPGEKARADALLARWGALAVLITRPIPLLAETVAVLAGASPLGWGRLTAATLAGALPSCLLYALTGATSRNVGSGVLMFALVMGVAGALYWFGRRVSTS
jgi:3-dehydroquinate synthase